MARIGCRCDDTITNDTHAATTDVGYENSAHAMSCQQELKRLTADSNTDYEIKICHSSYNDPDGGVIKLGRRHTLALLSLHLSSGDAYTRNSAICVPYGLFQKIITKNINKLQHNRSQFNRFALGEFAKLTVPTIITGRYPMTQGPIKKTARVAKASMKLERRVVPPTR